MNVKIDEYGNNGDTIIYIPLKNMNKKGYFHPLEQGRFITKKFRCNFNESEICSIEINSATLTNGIISDKLSKNYELFTKFEPDFYMRKNGFKKVEKEKKEIPKLPNKSLALVISALVSFVTSSALMQKIMLIANGTSFGIQDPIFGLDIAYYMFQKPVIETLALYFVILFVGLSIYIALYYVIAFNRYFDGVDGKMLKESLFMKKLTRNALLIIIGISILTVINTQNTMFGKILTVKNDLEIVGAGMTETTIKLWGYVIFAFVIIIFAYRALKYFKKGNTGKVLKNLAVIPGYLVVLFIVMVVFDLAFVSTNELDKEKEYIAENIKNTKNAYNINIEEKNIENSGTITSEEVEENANVINNIPVIIVPVAENGYEQRYLVAKYLGELLIMSNNNKEELAENFARALLMPEKSLKIEFGEKRTKIHFNEIIAYSNTYKVSYKNVVKRLLEEEIITASNAKYTNIYINKNKLHEIAFTEEKRKK